MPAHPAKVNLMPPSEFESSFWGKFLKWAVSTGRYMIILTEMVVIVAFLMRFKLDEDLRSLNEQIGGQVMLLQAFSPEEAAFRRVQTKINLGKKILDNRTKPAELLAYMDSRTPDGVMIKKRLIKPDEISLSALTLDQQAMADLMSTLSADARWKTVEVTELVGDKSNGIKFTLKTKE